MAMAEIADMSLIDIVCYICLQERVVDPNYHCLSQSLQPCFNAGSYFCSMRFDPQLGDSSEE